MTEKLSLKERANYEMVKRLIPVKETIKRWFCRAGMKFLQSHQLTDEQWTFLEDVTDFYMDNLENIEKDNNFIKKVVLPEIKLPNKKK